VAQYKASPYLAIFIAFSAPYHTIRHHTNDDPSLHSHQYFGPNTITGLREDPATVSVYSTLTPYYAKVLGMQNQELLAYQASGRGADIRLYLENNGKTVLICGQAVTVFKSTCEVFF